MPVPTTTATTVASICSGSRRARSRIAGTGISTTTRRPNRVFKRRRSRVYCSKSRVFAFIDVTFCLKRSKRCSHPLLRPCGHQRGSLAPECRLARGPLVDSTKDHVLDISHAGDELIHGFLRDSGPNRSAERVPFHTK